jgi:lipopolysaccharide heptosyltransferase II
MPLLSIYDRRERAIVGAVDLVLGAVAAVARPLRHRKAPRAPRRLLLLRLERIGDLVMALPAIRDVRAHAPGATIDLVVGSWNLPIARALPYVDKVLTLDAGWLARGGHGGGGMAGLFAAAQAWRGARYDVAINFEPDIRSNALLACSGARWTAGWTSGGGGPLLDVGLSYDTSVHTSENARRLVAAIFGDPPPGISQPLLVIPENVRRAAAERLSGVRGGPLVGVHVSGGRLVKQWEPARFAEVARQLIEQHGAAIVLTGGADDRPMVDDVKAVLRRDRVVDVAGGIDLLELAALLTELDLLITGDTGPMHVAAAVGTPVVAVFGPSDPVRYAPSGPADRTVRAGIECSPCNRIRKPPAHCVGHIPECLSSVPAAQVYEAARSSLEYSARHRRPANHATA